MTELGHLLTVDVVAKRLGWPQELRPALYLGAIAPDAHRATYGVDYRDLHFRSGRHIGRRLVDFLRRYLRPHLGVSSPEARAFFAGWLSHICADTLWKQRVRQEMSSLWQRIVEGSQLESATLRAEFYDECDWVDQQLYREQEDQVEDIRNLLERAAPRFTVPPLQLGDINRWRVHVMMDLLPPTRLSVERPQYLTLGFVEDSLEEAVEETVAMLDWEIKLAAQGTG